MVRLNPHLRQNCSIFMRNSKQNQHKLSNNHVQFSNRNLLCKFEPPSKKSWIRPCFYHLFYFIYIGQPIWDPYGTRLHCPYGSHTGAHMGPIWVPYRLLAGFFQTPDFCEARVFRGGVSIFFCMRRLEPSIYLSPPKISGISSTQNFFYPSLRIYENIRVPPPHPPPPPTPRESSCIVIPGAPVSQIVR